MTQWKTELDEPQCTEDAAGSHDPDQPRWGPARAEADAQTLAQPFSTEKVQIPPMTDAHRPLLFGANRTKPVQGVSIGWGQ